MFFDAENQVGVIALMNKDLLASEPLFELMKGLLDWGTSQPELTCCHDPSTSSWISHLRGARPAYWICQMLFWGGLWLADIHLWRQRAVGVSTGTAAAARWGVRGGHRAHLMSGVPSFAVMVYDLAALRTAFLPLFTGSVVLGTVLLVLSAHARVLPMLELPRHRPLVIR